MVSVVLIMNKLILTALCRRKGSLSEVSAYIGFSRLTIVAPVHPSGVHAISISADYSLPTKHSWLDGHSVTHRHVCHGGTNFYDDTR